MAEILITGGTGLVGKALTKLLTSRGDTVTILSREGAGPTYPGVKYARWDPSKGTIDEQAIGRADAIVHLAGDNVASGRWTQAKKERILKSRTQSSALLVSALSSVPNGVKSVVSASAIGYYGEDHGGGAFVETDPPDNGFLGEVCRLWEESIAPVQAMGKRLVILRTGIVLSRDGGMIPKLEMPLKVGVAGVLGKGEQEVSWIHIEDLCRMYEYALDNSGLTGPYNAVAPEPVRSETLIRELAEQRNGKKFITLHAPSFVLKLALGEMSTEILKSATVSGVKILQTGFEFSYPTVQEAIAAL